MGPEGPRSVGEGQWRSPTVLFMPVLHALLCVISLTSLVLCLSLSRFKIQEMAVHPSKGHSHPSCPFPSSGNEWVCLLPENLVLSFCTGLTHKSRMLLGFSVAMETMGGLATSQGRHGNYQRGIMLGMLWLAFS